MDTQELILAGIIPRTKESFDRKRILKAIDIIKDSYFDGIFKNIYKICIVYFTKTQNSVDEDVLKLALEQSNLSSDEKVIYISKFRVLRDYDVDDGKFDFSLQSLRTLKSTNFYVNSLEEAMSKLIQYRREGKDSLEALESSKADLVKNLSAIDFTEDKFEHNLKEVAEMKEELLAKPVKDTVRTSFGFRAVDRAVKFYAPGNLVIVGAYVSQGKTQYLINTAYSAVFQQKRNIVYVSLEMSTMECYDRILSRHSLNPKFDLEQGILHEFITENKLSPKDRKSLDRINQDIKDNEGKDYGFLRLVQLPVNASPEEVFRVADRINSSFRVDVLIIDYITLLKPSRKRQQSREEVSDMVKVLKQGALSFDRGRGIPIIGATQIGREEFKKASKTGEYTLSSFAESSALEQSADICMWLLRRKDIEEAAHEIKVGFVKRRNGGLTSIRTCNLYEDFSHSYLGDLAEKVY